MCKRKRKAPRFAWATRPNWQSQPNTPSSPSSLFTQPRGCRASVHGDDGHGAAIHAPWRPTRSLSPSSRTLAQFPFSPSRHCLLPNANPGGRRRALIDSAATGHPELRHGVQAVRRRRLLPLRPSARLQAAASARHRAPPHAQPPRPRRRSALPRPLRLRQALHELRCELRLRFPLIPAPFRLRNSPPRFVVVVVVLELVRAPAYAYVCAGALCLC